MIQFDRSYELIIGDGVSGDGFSITDLQLNFKINKVVDNNNKADYCQCVVTNLSDKQLALLEVDYPVFSLAVGYAEDNVELFRGEVTDVETKRNGPNRVTTFRATPRYTTLNHTLISSLIPDSGTVADVIEEIRKKADVTKGTYVGDQLAYRITYGYPLVGTPRQLLDQVCETYGLSWRIESDALYINAVDTVASEVRSAAPVLSYTTGLLEEPTPLKDTSGKSKDDPERRRGIRVRALINPRVAPGNLIKVVYKDVESFYRVDEVTYTGDYRGTQWQMECLCYTRIKEG